MQERHLDGRALTFRKVVLQGEKSKTNVKKLLGFIPPLPSEHIQSFLFPELDASASDPVFSERLSWTGHQMKVLDQAPPQGGNQDLKDSLGKKTKTPGPWREEIDFLSEVHQAVKGYMHIQTLEN